MRRFLLVVLLTFLFAPIAWAQDCTSCDFPFEPKAKVMWGKYAFCSEDCRMEWYLDRFRCKICNDKVTPKSNRTRSDDVLHVKQLLFDIGYWVSGRGLPRDRLSNELDLPMAHAVRAFQTRRFAGRERRYAIVGNMRSRADEYGTLDPETIKMIMRVWTARFP